MAKEAFYAVRRGRNPGIYKTWEECKSQTVGFSGAEFKKFNTGGDAQQFIGINISPPEPLASSPSMFSSMRAQTYHTIAKERYASGSSYTPEVSTVAESERKAQDYMGQYNKTSQRTTTTSKVSSSRKLQQHKSKNQGIYGVVFKNGENRIVKTWRECQQLTKGVQGVTFKKFEKLESAEQFVNQSKTDCPPLSPNSRDTMTQRFLENNSRVTMEDQRALKPTVIYCDGSFIPSQSGKDKAGYGIYFGPNDPRNKSIPLKTGPKNSYISEVRATADVLGQISSEIDSYVGEHWDTLPKYTISTDSETVKNILTQYSQSWTDEDYEKRTDVPELKKMVSDYRKIRNFYNKYSPIFNDHLFQVEWIKGHVGIHGNEEADRLAREAAEKSIL